MILTRSWAIADIAHTQFLLDIVALFCKIAAQIYDAKHLRCQLVLGLS